MLAGWGGTGGGEGGGGWPPIVTSTMDMQSFGIFNVAAPRVGAIGTGDAVNRETMEKAIAAGGSLSGHLHSCDGQSKYWWKDRSP